MRAHIKLGRLFGIPIGLHYSWVVIAVLITLSLAAHFSAVNADWSNATIWLTAIVTSFLFFGSLILHELAHALVARSKRIPVRSITLFALGGVAHIEEEAAEPRTEIWMGIVGPLTSAAIGGLCLLAAWALGWTPEVAPASPAIAMLQWLGYINFVLAVFNMLPGFPLDGGRVLRGVLWIVTGSQERATRNAAFVGRLVAYGLIGVGVVQLFAGAGIGGLWLAIIGWFLLEGAQATRMRLEISEQLQDVRVGDVMSRDCELVDKNETVEQFVEAHLLRTGRRCFLVRENGHVAGMVTPSDVKGADRESWPELTVDRIMKPLSAVRTVTPDTPLSEAFDVMVRQDLNQLPVVEGDHLEGVITRANVLQLLQARSELSVIER